MASSKLLVSLFIFQVLFITPAYSKLFREYIGADDKNVSFSDVPINPTVDFHYILSFAIDYTNTSSPSPTNGEFIAYWDKQNLNPSRISSIKADHPNVKVAMSLAGDSVNHHSVYFSPASISSWVSNAISSITQIVREYNLDGIDIDYEHFNADPDTFAECIGHLLFYLKEEKIVSFTSIAPFEDDSVQQHYLALWRKYGHLIDYVNFQFYAYDKRTTVAQFLQYFETQSSNYKGGKILVSFGTDESGGLKPKDGFFDACSVLKSQDKLHGIFIWSADDSKKAGFLYEKQSQDVLALELLPCGGLVELLQDINKQEDKSWFSANFPLHAICCYQNIKQKAVSLIAVNGVASKTRNINPPQ